jgi:hypothetical protein
MRCGHMGMRSLSCHVAGPVGERGAIPNSDAGFHAASPRPRVAARPGHAVVTVISSELARRFPSNRGIDGTDMRFEISSERIFTDEAGNLITAFPL